MDHHACLISHRPIRFTIVGMRISCAFPLAIYHHQGVRAITYSNPSPGFGATPGGAGPTEFLKILGSNSIYYGLSSGLVGGFLAALLASPFSGLSGGLVVSTAIWVGVIGGVLGFTIMAWEGLTSGAYARILPDGGFGAITGLVAGCIGGAVAQMIYTSLLANVTSADGAAVYLARGLAWGIFGALIGGGLGLRSGKTKILSGVIGGFAGGAVGGMGFQFAASVLKATSNLEMQIIGLMITGVGIGLGIGVAERILRDVWIRFDFGPLRGREYILYGDQTRIGRDPRNEICLANDLGLLPLHLSLLKSANQLILQSNLDAKTLVNDAPTSRCELKIGDRVALGESQFTVMSKPSVVLQSSGFAGGGHPDPIAYGVPWSPGYGAPGASPGAVYPVSEGASPSSFPPPPPPPPPLAPLAAPPPAAPAAPPALKGKLAKKPPRQ